MHFTEEFKKELVKRSEELKKNVVVKGDNIIDFDNIQTQKAFRKVLIESFRDSGMIIEEMLFAMAWRVEGENKKI